MFQEGRSSSFLKRSYLLVKTRQDEVDEFFCLSIIRSSRQRYSRRYYFAGIGKFFSVSSLSCAVPCKKRSCTSSELVVPSELYFSDFSTRTRRPMHVTSASSRHSGQPKYARNFRESRSCHAFFPATFANLFLVTRSFPATLTRVQEAVRYLLFVVASPSDIGSHSHGLFRITAIPRTFAASRVRCSPSFFNCGKLRARCGSRMNYFSSAR